MDFLKSCTSNVHVVENFLQIRFSVWNWKDADADDGQLWSGIQHTLTRLREQNVLCWAVENNIWAFGEIEDSCTEIVEEAFALGEQGTLDEEPLKSDPKGGSVKDILLCAIEAAIACSLAKSTNTLHVRPWTWLHFGSSDEEDWPVESSSIRLNARFGRTGALYLIPEIKQTPWSSIHTLPQSETECDVLLAPFGQAASTTPDQEGLTSDDPWKAFISVTLQAQGISLPEGVEWVAVRVGKPGDSGPAFIWPAYLCIPRYTPEPDALDILSEKNEWRHWFDATDDRDTFRNPLSEAEEWCQGAAERERAAQEAAKVDSVEVVQTDLPAPNANSTNAIGADNGNTVTSPFNQRLHDQQTTMAGIYPTPPDGLAQGSQPQPMASFATPSANQGDAGLSGPDLLQTSDDSQVKSVERINSIGMEDFSLGQEDLFGDVGDIDFGENDVGDADFNFFDDDQPDTNLAPDAMADAEMLQAPAEEEDGQSSLTHESVPAVKNAIEKIVPIKSPQPTVNSPTATERAPPVKEIIMSDEEKAVHIETSVAQFEEPPAEPERPLSPFGIRERLLPPPVPASLAQNDHKVSQGRPRNSSFNPIIFRDNLSLKPKYSIAELGKEIDPQTTKQPTTPSIALPPIRKKSRALRPMDINYEIDMDDESEEDSYESSTSESEPDIVSTLPSDNRKRKRDNDQGSPNPHLSLPARIQPNSDIPAEPSTVISTPDMLNIFQTYLTPDYSADLGPDILLQSEVSTNFSDNTDSVPLIETLYDLRVEDLICVAQVVNGQSMSSLNPQRSACDVLGISDLDRPPPRLSLTKTLIEQSLEDVFDGVVICDLSKIASTREPPPPPRAASNLGKAPHAPPRPPQRADSMMVGPDCYTLPPPYVKISRGSDSWEMLPTCLPFWETLGLGPANGPRHIRGFCIFPDNPDLQIFVEHFMADMGTAFESCKLGSHVHLRNVNEKEEVDSFEDGMAPVELVENNLQGALKAYAGVCVDLGRALATIGQRETQRTIVVYMVNPFRGSFAVQHLCACFWLLFKAYTSSLPRNLTQGMRSDVVLQILPISIVAAFDMLTVPSAKETAALARDIYDRCPPSIAMQNADNTSALPILKAPAVELASVAPRKINFQLSAEPPSSLLHEGSILHMAYALSEDGQWMTMAWTDSTGQNSSSTAACLRGRSFAQVAEIMWDRTLSILDARQVAWRVFIVTHQGLDRSVSHCWRNLTTKPRSQPVCVTLLTVQIDPLMQLSSPASPETASNPLLDSTFLTPASTPQGGNFTSSPDVSGAGGLGNNAPPTPAPSETAATLAENDPDAHLVDTTDETWALLLSPKLANSLPENTVGLANGALFKRGDGEPEQPLPSLGVSLHWIVQVKTNGSVDEGSLKQGELTLREVLRMFRNLGLLTKAKGLSEAKKVLPVHIAEAKRGVAGLERLLGRD